MNIDPTRSRDEGSGMADAGGPLKPLVAWALLKPEPVGSLMDTSVGELASLGSVLASLAAESTGETASEESVVNPPSMARTPKVTSPMFCSGSDVLYAEFVATAAAL